MRDFFALIWDVSDASASQCAGEIVARATAPGATTRRHLSSPGLFVLDLSRQEARNQIVPVHDISGAIVGAFFGSVFSRTMTAGTHSAVRSVGQTDGSALQRSDGRAVNDLFWGAYVAFLQSPSGQVVIADPTSSIPCYYSSSGSMTMVFSSLDACCFVDRSGFSVNREHIATLLTYDKFQNGESGLRDVAELLGGQRLRARGHSRELDFVWDPRAIAARPLDLPIGRSAELLRETTQAVVAAWAGEHDRILLNLSGGLDSSIVLSCLAHSGASARVLAVHQKMVSGDCPEETFAREAARHSEVRYCSIPILSDAPLPDVDKHPATPRPYRQFLAPDLSDLVGAELVAEVDALFTGQGGDHLFLVSRSPLVFADHVRLKGVGRDTPAMLYQTAVLSGKFMPEVLSEAVPYLRGMKEPRRLIDAIGERRNLINAACPTGRDIVASLPLWMRSSCGLPPAKFEQIATLPHMYQFRRPLDRDGGKAVVHPLISQPLIELCLRLPTYQLCHGGLSRGLARLAFAGEIPERIRHRVTKGSASRFFRDRIKNQRDQIASALLEGQIVAQGLASAGAIEAFLQKGLYKDHKAGHMVLVYYAIEAWLRRWDALTHETSGAPVSA